MTDLSSTIQDIKAAIVVLTAWIVFLHIFSINKIYNLQKDIEKLKKKYPEIKPEN